MPYDLVVRFWKNLFESVLVSAVGLVKIVLLYLIARAVIFSLIDKSIAPVIARQVAGGDEHRAARARTLQGLLKSVIGYVLFFIAVVMTLNAFKIETASVLTAAGVVGLAVGFGAQRLVRDVIAGFFILLENQFAVGEYITAAGVTGTVEEVGMRITRIIDDAGKLNIIANGDITNICNHSRGAVAVFMDISVPADTDIDKVTSVLDNAGLSESEGLVSPLKYTGIIAADAGKVTLRFSGKCDAKSVETVQMAARERFRDALREAGINLA
ncbi:MAG: mechanosensitive ion channel family protein [Armatimonadota bacterium]|nr:mechanosensitive ion channel family protein [Armatimonadota bacterium]